MSPLFINGALAWATLGLISIPIIIHLIHRRRFLRLDWAAMEFLLQALKRARRRLRLEQLILLLVRIALMALLGLFLARPILSGGGLEWLASALRSEERIFILDDSFSTKHREAGRTAFDREVEALSSQIRRLAERGGRRLTIVKGSRPRAPIVLRGFVDQETAAIHSRSLERYAPSDTRLPLATALEAVADSADTEGTLPARLVAILTDLRATDWSDPGGGPDEAVHAALLRLSGSEDVQTDIVVLDAGSDDTGNVAIVDAAVAGGRPVQGIPTEVRVEVRNHGATEVRGLGIRLRLAPAPAVSGQEAAAATVLGPPVDVVPPGGTAVCNVPCTFRGTGDYGVTVELTGANDSLPEDNTYPLAVKVAEGIDVLVISGEPSSDPYEGESDFLVQALAPIGEYSSGIRPTVVVEENLPRGGLEKHAAVFVLNVHSFPPDFLPLLGRYVRSGGALVIFPGDQVDAALYNRQLGPPGGGEDAGPERGLLPARLGNIVGSPDSPLGIRFAVDHPYFRILRGMEEHVGGVHFQRRFELDPLPSSQVLATFTDIESSPAIVEHAVEKGRTILLAVPADLEWSDWPPHPTYLMVLQEMVAAIVQSRAQRTEPVAGAPLEIPVDIALFSQEARLRVPGYPSSPERVLAASPAPVEEGSEEARSFRFVIDDTSKAGLYAFQLEAKSGESEWREIAIRRDPRESDLTRISEARLRDLYPDVDLTVVRDPAAFSDVGRGGFEASDLLLWAFVALLFIEALLARLFAHHRTGAAAGAPGGVS